MNNWAVSDIAYKVFDVPFNLVLTTFQPCHLWSYYTLEPPDIHKTTRTIRGLTSPWGAYFCFVGWKVLEQYQSGDTLEHTFYFYDWPECTRYYFLFKGTVAAASSPSVSPIFNFHRPSILTCPCTYSCGYLVAPRGRYDFQHESPVAFFIDDGDVQRHMISQWAPDWGISVRREGLFFNTAQLDPSYSVQSGRVELNAIRGGINPLIMALVKGTSLHDPLVFTDFGYLKNQTTNLGSTYVDTWVHWHYLYLTPPGLATLNPGGVSKLGLRLMTDILYHPPTGEEYIRIYSDYSGTPPALKIAYTR